MCPILSSQHSRYLHDVDRPLKELHFPHLLAFPARQKSPFCRAIPRILGLCPSDSIVFVIPHLQFTATSRIYELGKTPFCRRCPAFGIRYWTPTLQRDPRCFRLVGHASIHLKRHTSLPSLVIVRQTFWGWTCTGRALFRPG